MWMGLQTSCGLLGARSRYCARSLLGPILRWSSFVRERWGVEGGTGCNKLVCKQTGLWRVQTNTWFELIEISIRYTPSLWRLFSSVLHLCPFFSFVNSVLNCLCLSLSFCLCPFFSFIKSVLFVSLSLFFSVSLPFLFIHSVLFVSLSVSLSLPFLFIRCPFSLFVSLSVLALSAYL